MKVIDTNVKPHLFVGSGLAPGRETLEHNEKFGDVVFDPEQFGVQLLFFRKSERLTPFNARVLLNRKGLLPLNAAMCDFLQEHPEMFPKEWKKQQRQFRWYNHLFPNLGRREFTPTILFLGSHVNDHNMWIRTLTWKGRHDCSGAYHEGPECGVRALSTVVESPYSSRIDYIEPDEAVAYMTKSQINQD